MAKKPEKVKRFRAFKVILLSIISFILLASVIESYVELNSTYNKLSDAQAELADCKSENVRLESKLEAQVSVKNVENYAENVLGMKKLDSSQVRYIKIADKDEVSLPEEDENFFVKIKVRISDIIDYLMG